MKRWKCMVCGQVFEGDEPPVPCPICGAGRDAFELLDAPRACKWKCSVCKQVFEGDEPPVPCPVCGAGTDAFSEVDEGSQSYRKDTDESFVIIGGGIAGLEAAKAIRERNATASITIVSDEQVLPYNRPGLSDMIADGCSIQALQIEDERFYSGEKIAVRCGIKAERIDPQTKTVFLSNGETIAYDKLLLATGARAFNPVPGIDGGVCCQTLRSYEDAQSILRHCHGKRVVVVGGGILGIEAALALWEQQATVTIVEMSDRIMSIQADAEVSERIRKELEERGIRAFTGNTVQALKPDGVLLGSGQQIEADFVLVSAGVRSNLDLAKALGLSINRGILVDQAMHTSMADIYAAGDCAEANGRVEGLWGASSLQGQVAGAQMAGDVDRLYKSMVPATAFESGDVKMFSAGVVNDSSLDVVLSQSASGDVYKKLLFKSGKLVGVLLYGDTHGSGRALSLIEQGAGMEQAAQLLVL